MTPNSPSASLSQPSIPPPEVPVGPPGQYDNWKAPRGDTDILVWPAPAILRTLPPANADLLANTPTRLCGVPLAEVRTATRRYLGHDSPAPLIVTGHQTELHHPGVWIKNAVIHALANALGGRAMHLAVDTDQPKHLVLRYPFGSTLDIQSAEIPLSDDPAASRASWAGRVSGPTPVHATELERRFATDSRTFGFDPVAPQFLSALRLASLEEGVLPRMMTAGLHQLDWNLGLKYDAILASPLWEYEGFLLLCCEIISRADQYAAAYNAALAAYRQAEGIDTEGRPMPDLRATPTVVELPFWLDNESTGERSRPTATFTNGAWTLNIAGHAFTPQASAEISANPSADTSAGWDAARELQRLLRRLSHRLAPRALTLTTFVRLCFADLFIHGIGGGRYDQVTDRTLVSFFGLSRPPAFAVATGTLYFPWAQGRQRSCLPCVQHEGHQLRHAVLGQRKRDIVAAITQLPPRSPERKRLFLDMQSQLHAQWKMSPGLPALVDWQQRLLATERAQHDDALLFDRELFYALQPRTRLTAWIEKVRTLLAE